LSINLNDISININDILFRYWIWQGGPYDFDQLAKDSVRYIPPHHLLKIEDSIHFKAIASNDYTTYNNFNKAVGEEGEHSELKFRELKDRFYGKALYKYKIRLNWHEELNKYIVADGRHRLSIARLRTLGTTNLLPRDWFIVYE
tara:strand:+ start:59 stop:490 length:432 start_codon:yes stop_codon:yes gene_type:complete